MAYPYWLIIAGAVSILIGSIGLALQREAVSAILDDKASGEVPAEPQDNLGPVEAYNGAAKQKRKARWIRND